MTPTCSGGSNVGVLKPVQTGLTVKRHVYSLSKVVVCSSAKPVEFEDVAGSTGTHYLYLSSGHVKTALLRVVLTPSDAWLEYSPRSCRIATFS
jgi:hypothetical protein